MRGQQPKYHPPAAPVKAARDTATVGAAERVRNRSQRHRRHKAIAPAVTPYSKAGS